jgi:hypothetical protein
MQIKTVFATLTANLRYHLAFALTLNQLKKKAKLAMNYNFTVRQIKTLEKLHVFNQVDYTPPVNLKKEELINLLQNLLLAIDCIDKNSRKHIEMFLQVQGIPMGINERLNMPSFTGLINGYKAVSQVDQSANMCAGCAFRKGSIANMCFDTLIDAKSTAVGWFKCHENDAPRDEKPICVGHDLISKG